MAKAFSETGVGKFLSGKGFDTILSAVGTFIPGVSLLQKVKDDVIGSPSYQSMAPADQAQFLALHEADLKAAQDMENAMYADTANARQREVEIAKTSRTDWMMYATGIIGLLGFLFMVYVTVYVEISETNKALFNILIGVVLSNATTIFNYYFGSSSGSKAKDDVIKNMNQ